MTRAEQQNTLRELGWITSVNFHEQFTVQQRYEGDKRF